MHLEPATATSSFKDCTPSILANPDLIKGGIDNVKGFINELAGVRNYDDPKYKFKSRILVKDNDCGYCVCFHLAKRGWRHLHLVLSILHG